MGESGYTNILVKICLRDRQPGFMNSERFGSDYSMTGSNRDEKALDFQFSFLYNFHIETSENHFIRGNLNL